MSVRPSICQFVRLSVWNNSTPTGRILMKFYIYAFFENLPRKFDFHWNPTRITDTLHFWQYLAEFFLCPITFFRKLCRLWDMSKNVVEPETLQMTIWRHTRLHTHALTRAHIHTPKYVSNTYSFSTATVVSRTRLSVTVYVHCLAQSFHQHTDTFIRLSPSLYNISNWQRRYTTHRTLTVVQTIHRCLNYYWIINGNGVKEIGDVMFRGPIPVFARSAWEKPETSAMASGCVPTFEHGPSVTLNSAAK
jgi:hypothetical protein